MGNLENKPNPEYKGIICVEITKKEPNDFSIDLVYFVPAGERIRVFIDRWGKIEEMSLSRILDYSLRERAVQIYNLSDVNISTERRKRLEKAGLQNLLHQS